MKHVLVVVSLMVTFATVCSAQTLVHFFNKDASDHRMFFTRDDSIVTLKVVGDPRHPEWNYQLGEILIRAYPKKIGRELAAPTATTLPASSEGSAPATTINLRACLTGATEMVVVSITAIFVFESGATKRKATVNRSALYREFIRSGK